MSLVESPTLLNPEMSWFRLEAGEGMLLLAAAWLAVLVSLLPSFIYQLGPPSCKITTKPKKMRKVKQKTCQLIKILHAILRTYNDNGVSSSNGQYISTRDHTRTHILHYRLDMVNHFVSSDRVPIRTGILLSYEVGRVIKENGAVASLSS